MSRVPEIDEEEIRRALAAEALAYEPPAGLAERTIAEAKGSGRPGLLARMGGWVEGRKARRTQGFPKWAFAGVALMVLLGLYGIGNMALKSGTNLPGAPELDASRPSGGEEQARGQFETKTGMPPDSSVSQPAAAGCAGRNCPSTAVGDSGASGGKGLAAPGPASDIAAGAAGAAARRAAPTAQTAPDMVASVPPGPPPVPNAAAGPAVIRNGQMEVRVRKGGFGAAWAQASSIAAKHGGVVASSSADQVEGRLSRGTLTVRVPAANLDAAIADFQRLGKVVHLTSSSSDVSGQLVDYDARIRAAQARELQLLELLKQAHSVSDSLQVGTALSDVRTEIESLQAQRTNLQSQVEMAALTLSIYEPQAAPEDPTPFEGRLEGAWERALDAGALTLSAIVVGAGFFLPLVVLALILWGGLRMRKRAALR